MIGHPFSGIEPFVWTAELQSFTAAAQHLGVTPAAVSKAVANLEDTVGLRLLNRTSRRVSLTPEGAVYLRHCRRALEELATGREALAAASGAVAGTLRASFSPVLSQPVVAALPQLREQHPRLELDLRFTDRFAGLLADEVDVAVRIGDLSDSTLVARKLADTRWRMVAAPVYLSARGHPKHPGELAQHDCLHFRRSDGTPQPWTLAPSPGDDPRPVDLSSALLLDLGTAIVDAAEHGLGIALAFDFMVRDRIDAGRLVEVLPEHTVVGPPVHAVVAPGRQRTPNIRAFVDFLLHALR